MTGFAVSKAQRDKAKNGFCVISGASGCDPAHVIDRGRLTAQQDDPRAVIPLRRDLHRLYDTGSLDLLPYLEPAYRVELSFAVERYGLLNTLERVTNTRWCPVEERRAA